jgi:hypothetical protein
MTDHCFASRAEDGLLINSTKQFEIFSRGFRLAQALKFAEAEPFFRRSMFLLKGQGEAEARAIRNLGVVICHRKRYPEAKVYMLSALKMSYELGLSVELQQNTSISLAIVMRKESQQRARHEKRGRTEGVSKRVTKKQNVCALCPST